MVVRRAATSSITVRHGEHSGLHRVRAQAGGRPGAARARARPRCCTRSPTTSSTSYLAVTEAIENDIDEIEAEVFAPALAPWTPSRSTSMKREVLELRRAVVPLGGPLRKLTEGYSSLVPHEVRSYFRDVDDHLATVTERVAGFDELLTTLVDAVLAKITHAAEQRHAQDHRVRGDHLGADDGGRHLRHELRLHARAALAASATRDAGPDRWWPAWCCSGCSAATSGCDRPGIAESRAQA